jgi:UDP-2,4-diacetamido-2,4,6-trideoxy-beta-L-altropyranose hydrolase
MDGNSQEITYRAAALEDVQLVFSWNNDALVRAQSFRGEPIEFEKHVIWFGKKLSSLRDLLLIVLVHDIPAGLIRFESSDGKVVVGIIIDAKFRGKGLGPSFIKGAIAEYCRRSELPIFAYIKKNNVASLKAFERAGFDRKSEEEINGHPCFVYVFGKTKANQDEFSRQT